MVNYLNFTHKTNPIFEFKKNVPIKINETLIEKPFSMLMLDNVITKPKMVQLRVVYLIKERELFCRLYWATHHLRREVCVSQF